MCDKRPTGDSQRSRDAGMTLIEVLVSVMMVGLLSAVISAAIIVVLRNVPVTEARLDSARWEQNLGTWLPADLASAGELPLLDSDDPLNNADFPTDPEFPPPSGCGNCATDDNVLQLGWTDGGAAVEVTYRYGPAPTEGTWQFRRVECRPSGCVSIVLVNDMPEPTDGLPPIVVSYPPDLALVDTSGNPISDTSARRVTITVTNPTGAGGTSDLTFTGGGADLVNLLPAQIDPPDFLQANSRCGGPITLIVDESGSIGSAVGDVREGVRSFVEAFAGTPTQLQIVGMGTSVSNSTSRSRAFGAGGAWNHVYDLTNVADVDDALDDAGGINNNGWTNWEDALFRALHYSDGSTYEAHGDPRYETPELIVFFTDGLPTAHRADNSSGRSGTSTAWNYEVPSAYQGEETNANGNVFSPRGWYRANQLVEAASATRLIGVGVGNAFDNESDLDDHTGLDSSERAQWANQDIPAEVLLGDLVAPAVEPRTYAGTNQGYLVDDYETGGWNEDIDNVDLLVTNDFDALGSALERIALAECGGTLTVQTRRASDETPVAGSVTYETTAVGSDDPPVQDKTSAVDKTAVFDIATASSAAQVVVDPLALPSGYSPNRWECRSRNVLITDPSRVALVAPGDLMAGVRVTVQPNEAVSCILFVN